MDPRSFRDLLGCIALFALSACGAGGSPASEPPGTGADGALEQAELEADVDAAATDGLLPNPAADAALDAATDTAANVTADAASDAASDAATDASASEASRYIVRVVSFTPGPGAGFGQSRMPDVVYGPPVGGGACRGSTDVVALGTGGEIVVEMGTDIVDGPGPDLLVFENPFYIGCDPKNGVYAELGEISVSEDGVAWATFPCVAGGPPYGSCAGWHPVSDTANAAAPGGDPFDLADVGVTRARFVRVRDVASGADPGGFDLDAMAVTSGL
jgi:hypothetical protein